MEAARRPGAHAAAHGGGRIGPRSTARLSGDPGDRARAVQSAVAHAGAGRHASAGAAADTRRSAQRERTAGAGAGGLARRAPRARCRRRRAGGEAHRLRRTAADDHRRPGARRAARRPQLDDHRPPFAAVDRVCAAARAIGRRGAVCATWDRARRARSRASAVPARTPAGRHRRAREGEGRGRGHPRPQHLAAPRNPRLRRASHRRARCRHRPRHPLPRHRGGAGMARRDQLHHPPSLGGRLRPRPAARLQLRQRPHRRSAVAERIAAGAPQLQSRTGDRPARVRPADRHGRVRHSPARATRTGLAAAPARLRRRLAGRVLDHPANHRSRRPRRVPRKTILLNPLP